jgi:hypothetical protein
LARERIAGIRWESLESEMLSEEEEEEPNAKKDKTEMQQESQINHSIGRAQARKCKRKATPQCPPLIDRLIDKNNKGYFEGKELWISNADVDDAPRWDPVLEGGDS